MWLLGCILPLIIGDLVPEGEAKWKNFLVMMRIVDLLFAPDNHWRSSGLFIAANKIYEPLSQIPKMHFMIHIPRLIL